MMKLDYSHHSPRRGHHVGASSKHRPRPLGSVRVSNSIDTIPKFPPLVHGRMPPMDKKYEGISGNKMAVPPPKLVHADVPHARPDSKLSERSSVALRDIVSSHQRRTVTPSTSSIRCSSCTCPRVPELNNKEQQIQQLIVSMLTFAKAIFDCDLII